MCEVWLDGQKAPTCSRLTRQRDVLPRMPFCSSSATSPPKRGLSVLARLAGRMANPSHKPDSRKRKVASHCAFGHPFSRSPSCRSANRDAMGRGMQSPAWGRISISALDCAIGFRHKVQMPTCTPTPFTANIRARCASAGISLREFMRRTGMANSALTRWETGHPPWGSSVEKVERVLKEMEDGN